MYKLNLTKGEIQVDADEVEKVMNGLETDNLVKLRQGIFNPKMFVSLVEDKERKSIWWEDNRLLPTGEREPARPLKDIFTSSTLKELP